MSKKNTLEKFGTDIERLRKMTDDEIDYSDIPPITEEMFARSVLRKKFKIIPKKNQDNLPIDKDIIEYFKSQDFNYSAKINEILREYMEANENK